MRTPRPVARCDSAPFCGADDLTVRKRLPALHLRDHAGLRHWHGSGRVPRLYPAGTDGPVDVTILVECEGRRRHEEAA